MTRNRSLAPAMTWQARQVRQHDADYAPQTRRHATRLPMLTVGPDPDTSALLLPMLSANHVTTLIVTLEPGSDRHGTRTGCAGALGP